MLKKHDIGFCFQIFRIINCEQSTFLKIQVSRGTGKQPKWKQNETLGMNMWLKEGYCIIEYLHLYGFIPKCTLKFVH